MMHFLLLGFLTATLAAVTIVHNSFNDLSERSDFQLPQDDLTITSQDSPQDLLAFDGSSGPATANSFIVNDDNDNLFADSNSATDSFPGVGNSDLDYFDLAEASSSCPSKDGGGQPLNKLRARDGVCTSDGQPSGGGIDEFIDNAVGFFGNPFGKKKGETQGSLTTENDSGSVCRPEFPNHLCCEEEGLLDRTRRGNIFFGFDKCQLGT